LLGQCAGFLNLGKNIKLILNFNSCFCFDTGAVLGPMSFFMKFFGYITLAWGLVQKRRVFSPVRAASMSGAHQFVECATYFGWKHGSKCPQQLEKLIDVSYAPNLPKKIIFYKKYWYFICFSVKIKFSELESLAMNGLN